MFDDLWAARLSRGWLWPRLDQMKIVGKWCPVQFGHSRWMVRRAKQLPRAERVVGFDEWSVDIY